MPRLQRQAPQNLCHGRRELQRFRFLPHRLSGRRRGRDWVRVWVIWQALDVELKFRQLKFRQLKFRQLKFRQLKFRQLKFRLQLVSSLNF